MVALESMVEVGLAPSEEAKEVKEPEEPGVPAEPDVVEDDEADEGSAMADGRDDEAERRWESTGRTVGLVTGAVSLRTTAQFREHALCFCLYFSADTVTLTVLTCLFYIARLELT